MIEAYHEELKLSRNNRMKLNVINRIIQSYVDQGYRLTLRQLYYQLVSRNIIPNTKAEYAKLSDILVQGRMGGIVDWDAIEDRIRIPFIPYFVSGIPDAINDTIEQYRLDRLEDQEVYLECWVEKDALSGVLKRITSHYHIRLLVNRGYSSCTAMHDAALRIINKQNEKDCHILYLGDHDPSGVDMVRDIKHRLQEFGARANVKRIAITQGQIKKYNPPPNPAKIKDPRAKAYIETFGNISWEVDALNPEVLHEIVRKEIIDLIDLVLFNSKLAKEKADKLELESFRQKM